ncbi:Phosphate butyryltransferase [Lentibacillus sp. JNUCC-1]|uniref:phosphate acyltransferase n=1 Tax=Lentibacillus sp. JNUCC-1 TaxID=2654513 RepID=UPI0012E7AAA2|nr:phosphate acyltransferase [Lentibacillus sp. JNUCC-1]MUV38158.1 Phosphate butyryltransferase [Lentibacillus sp. JNUCC-1]
MLHDFEELEQKIANIEEPKKVAVVKAANNHALESIFELADQGIVIPYLIDSQSELETLISKLGIQNTNYHIINEETDEDAAFKGVELVRNNQVDFIMKGDIPTGKLLKQVVNRETGIRDKDVLSHMALIDVPAYDKLLGVTDGGMLLTPDVDQKEALIYNALDVMKALDYDNPKFAVLSAAEAVQPKLPASTDAVELTKRFESNSECTVEGPISLDLAINASIAEEKGYQGKIQGDADVLVAAEVVGGNTLSKSMLLLANAYMAGVILGAQVPIVLTSRSSSSAEKRYSLLLALQVSHAKEVKGE